MRIDNDIYNLIICSHGFGFFSYYENVDGADFFKDIAVEDKKLPNCLAKLIIKCIEKWDVKVEELNKVKI